MDYRRRSRRTRINSLFFAILAAGLLSTNIAEAELFELSNGGRLEGVLLNPDQVPRTTYRIGLPGGAQVLLSHDAVRSVDTPSQQMQKYDRVRVEAPDTVQGQLDMAAWCQENYLATLADRHLERVLELDPDNPTARARLGYQNREGTWTTQADLMADRGYIQYNGRWRLPQQAAIEQAEERFRTAEAQWRKDLGIWSSWFGTPRSGETVKNIVAIEDPAAIGPLVEQLVDEKNPKIRELYLSALHRIDSPVANMEILQWMLKEPTEDLRLTCLEYVQDDPRTVNFFIDQLSAGDPGTINDAAFALKRIGDKRAVPFLIKSLKTQHTYKTVIGGSGQMDATFGSGGTGFASGSKEIVKTVDSSNQDVLEALVELTGVNHGFDVAKWRAWWYEQRQIRYFNLRRG